MNGHRIQGATIDYPRQWFVVGTIIYIPVTILLFYIANSAKEDFGRNVWLAVGLAEGILMFLFLVPSLFTHHILGEKALRLRMGLLVNVSIPYRWIKEVKETSIHRGAIRVGIGVRYSPIPKILFITSSFSNVVIVKLDGDHRLGRILKRPVGEIVLSVNNGSALIDALRKRAGIPRGV